MHTHFKIPPQDKSTWFYFLHVLVKGFEELRHKEQSGREGSLQVNVTTKELCVFSMYVHALNLSPRCFLLICLICSSHSQVLTQTDTVFLTSIPLGGTVLFYFQLFKSYLLLFKMHSL